MKKNMVIIGLLGLAIGVWTLSSAWAAEEETEQKTQIPDTVGGIWQEVKGHEEELGKLIANKKLDKVHEVAFAIRDLVNALPDKSKDLPADKLAKVKTNTRYVADLADRLDKSGDANDQAGTEANFKKLHGILKTIEAQYSPAAHEHEEKGERSKESDEGKKVTLQGELIDTYCFVTRGGDARGKHHAECAQKCMVSGIPAGILPEGSQDSDAMMYLLTNPQVLAPYAAQTIKVEGTQYEHKHAIDVKKLYIKDGDNWKEIQLQDERHKMAG